MPGPNGERCGDCQCWEPIDTKQIADLQQRIAAKDFGTCMALPPTVTTVWQMTQVGPQQAIPMPKSDLTYPNPPRERWCIHMFKRRKGNIQ